MNETQTTPTSHPYLVPAIAAAGLAAVALAATPARAVSPALTYSNIPGKGDVQVLNYALALEDLEADLYGQALLRLTTGGTNALGTVIPGLNISANQADVKFVNEFKQVEIDHRDFLRANITAAGGPTISPFRYNFGMESRTRQQVVDLVYTAEKTGVGAYLGAIVHFATKDYLQVAGAIQGTEARHTAVFAAVLNFLFNEGLSVAPPYNLNHGIDQPIAPDTVLAAVSPFIVVG